MSAPDFYFVNNAMFRHIHDRFGHDVLVQYWRGLGRDFYAQRIERWAAGGMSEIARDWTDYFAKEPQADVVVLADGEGVEINVRVCPAIKHLRDHGREIVSYFCEHCDHVTGAMVEPLGLQLTREGGMGSCRQTITRVTVAGRTI